MAILLPPGLQSLDLYMAPRCLRCGLSLEGRTAEFRGANLDPACGSFCGVE